MLDPIHLLLDGLPQHRIVDHLKDKQRFRNLSKRLQRPIEGVLLRVRVEPAEQVLRPIADRGMILEIAR